MNTKELLIHAIEEIPEPLLTEMLDFVRSLQSKSVNEKYECAIQSESSLTKDWLKAEEDEAWRDL